MIFRPCREAGTQLEEYYKQRVMGEVLMYQSRHMVRVKCPCCGEYMAEGFLEVHCQTHHGVDTGGRKQWDTPPLDGDP